MPMPSLGFSVWAVGGPANEAEVAAEGWRQMRLDGGGEEVGDCLGVEDKEEMQE
ncbi:hypothetical protein NQZ68_016378 [Dissostichus eleginoides]|nr:hypothetical protein NQZ68_016378 [Dissostichus eleginoides]